MSFAITVTRREVSVSFDVGSLSEAVAILEEEDTQLRKITKIADTLSDDLPAVSGGETAQEPNAAGEPARRGRKPKDKNQPDPATATAPAPLPVPPAAGPVDMTPDSDGVPAGLRRDPATNTAPAIAPPPPPPPAPPAPAAAPPSGILAGKVIANLDQRATDDATKKSLVDWLASPAVRLVNAGSSYDESIAAIRLMPDDKLAQVATALAVA